MISVIVCTYNRCKSLKATLDSLLVQECDGSFDYEVIVVDNNSKDRTRKVVESYLAKFDGRLRYVFEHNQGLAFARNKGIKEAKGKIIAFSDDDVIAPDCWIKHIYKAFKERDCVGIGGRVLPKWPDKEPEWFIRNGEFAITGPVAIHDNGNKPSLYSNKMCPPIGANMAYKREVFNRYGYFNTVFDRKGNGLGGSEDTEFGRRLLNANEKIVYCPNASIFHIIGPSRARRNYFRKWYFNSGRVNIFRSINKKPTMLFGMPRYLFRQLIERFYKFLNSLITVRRKERFYWELQILNILGQMFGSIRLKKDSYAHRD